MATLLQIASRQRNELAQTDAENLRRIAEAYALMHRHLQGDVDALMLAIGEMDNPTKAEIEALPQYKRLMRDAKEELDRFTTYLSVAIGAASVASIALGLTHSSQLMTAITGNKVAGLDSGGVQALLNYLRRDGPLYARLQMITTSTLDNVIKTIVEGVASGFNPKKIAGLIQDAFGGGLTDALRNMRTVQLWSYRDSARANYMASDGIVTGWIWWAELDELTCEACVAEHGSIHPLDEQLDGHYNCRCAALPYIEGLTEPTQTGEEWYNTLTEAQQKDLLGPGKYAAFQEGKFQFSQLSKQTPNEVYGSMRVATPLKDLVND
jgi:hypothetical protein